MTQRILITGGAGFIGSRLAKSLARHNEVMIFDNFHPQVHGYSNVEQATGLVGICRIVRGDVANATELHSAVRSFNPDLIYHLAAETGTGQSYDEPTRYNLVNVIGTTNLIEAVRAHGPAVRRIILSGSRAIYGEGAARNPQGLIRNAPPRRMEDMRDGDFALKDEDGVALVPVSTAETLPVSPASIYASTKLMQEYICRQCVVGTAVEVVVLRLQNVYGPGQSLRNPYTGVISIFCQKVEQGEWLEVFEDGEIIRDFVYVDDVVEAFCACASLPSAPLSPINIGTGSPVSICSMAKMVLALYGRSQDEHRITGNFRAGDVRHAVAEIAVAQQVLGWRPSTDFETGLRKFVDWAKANHVALT